MDKHKSHTHHSGAAPKTGAFTLGQGLGLPSQHSGACWEKIKAAQQTRSKMRQLRSVVQQHPKFKEFEDARRAFNDARRALSKHPEFKIYEDARAVFSSARQILSKDPNFSSYEKARNEDIEASKAMFKAKKDCPKCKASAEIAGER